MLTPDQITASAPDAASLKAGRIIPDKTRETARMMVLVSGLCEGGSVAGMMKTAARLKESGGQLISLLALSDDGKPWYDAKNAAAFAELDIPVFACTPDRFPDLMAAALAK